MLNDQELKQVRDYVIRILPELLREEPEIAATIEGILAQHFPRRDEFTRLLDELKQLREEMDRRFTQQSEEMDRRFEEMDRRFTLLSEEMDRRFTQQSEEMDRRFEQTNRTLLEVRRDIAKLQHDHEMLLRRLDGQEAWLRLVIGDLRAEKGRTFEDLFAEGLRYGLQNPNITPETLRLRQKLVDTEGDVFPPGFETEVDLIAENNKLTVFEFKATAKASEVGLFALKVRLVAAQNPDKSVEGVFIALGAGPEIQQRCAEHGLRLVA